MTRSLLLAATLAVTSVLVAAPAQADPTVPDAPSVSVPAGYWACVAIDHLHLGGCIDNPLPDLSDQPSVRQIVADATGVDV